MSFKIKNTIKNIETGRYFDSDESHGDVPSNWLFKYITLNTAGKDITTHPIPSDIETDKDQYPAGTIFFDGGSRSVYISNIISDIIIDQTKPEFISEDVQYTTFNSNRKCKFNIKSNSLIDVCQLVICVIEYKNDDIENSTLVGDYLYYCQRKEPDNIKYSDNIHNITYQRAGDEYTLYFEIDSTLDLEEKVDKETGDVINRAIFIKIWNIAGNSATYLTGDSWKNIDSNINDLIPLRIDFIDINPKDRVIARNVEGTVRVKISNFNIQLRSIKPTVRLAKNSVGHINENKMEYDPETGVLLFDIDQINRNGMVIVEAWIDVENDEIKSIVKTKTYAKESIGPFMYMDDKCRKYKFNGYVPTYLDDELYKSFIQHVQTFLNTSQFSLNNGNYISTLEKIARINNFNDPIRIENPLLSEYSKQFGIEINPTLDKYMYYLDHQPAQGSDLDKKEE